MRPVTSYPPAVPLADVNDVYTDLVTSLFSSTIAAKAWFATAAVVLTVVQVTTAARMWGRLGFSACTVQLSPLCTAGRDGSRSCSRCRSSSIA
ncbi:MAG: DUF6529 family protein [Gaiellaceae bacterium]